MAGTLTFTRVPGSWRCGNDWPKGTVHVTKITGPGAIAFLYMCNMNLDYDGAPTAYGPPGTHPLDYIGNAGPDPDNGWYGVASLTKERADQLRKLDPTHTRPVVDTNATRDVKGRYPVVQQAGEPAPGYYVSASSIPADSSFPEWDQRRWLDSTKFPFGALSGHLKSAAGLTLDDFGLAIRFDRSLTSGFAFKDSGGAKSWAVGECSYKLFTELGGHGRDNNFSIAYMVFPNSHTAGQKSTIDMINPGVKAQMAKLSQADNADDLPLLMAFYSAAGKSRDPLLLFTNYKTKPDGDKAKPYIPSSYFRFARALREWGFTLKMEEPGDYVRDPKIAATA